MSNKFYQLTNKSFDNEEVSTHKELWDKVKGEHRGFSLTVNTEFQKSLDDEGNITNSFHVVMSTAVEDRHGEIVFQNWDLENFKKNPVFLDSHNYGSIEHILGKVHNALVVNGKLEGDIEFALDNPKGMLAFKLALGGFLNATSVGFIPKGFDDDGNITSAELLEDSAVSVPANPEALLNSKSLEISDEPEEDTDSPTPQEEVEIVENTEEMDTETEGESREVEVKSQTPEVYAVLINKMGNDREILNAVAKVLIETRPSTIAERKRKILRDLRKVIT